MSPHQLAGLDTRLGYLLREVSALLHNRFSEALAAHDVSPPLWAVLITLHRGEATTPLALARRIDADPAAMTRRLDQLEAKGLVERRRDPDDRRSVVLEMTPAGERLVPKLSAISSQITNAALEGVSPGERTRLVRALRRMLENVRPAEGRDASGSEVLERASA